MQPDLSSVSRPKHRKGIPGGRIKNYGMEMLGEGHPGALTWLWIKGLLMREKVGSLAAEVWGWGTGKRIGTCWRIVVLGRRKDVEDVLLCSSRREGMWTLKCSERDLRILPEGIAKCKKGLKVTGVFIRQAWWHSSLSMPSPCTYKHTPNTFFLGKQLLTVRRCTLRYVCSSRLVVLSVE